MAKTIIVDVKNVEMLLSKKHVKYEQVKNPTMREIKRCEKDTL